MGTRSLQASQKGIEKAKISLAKYSLSQNALAKDLGLSRSTVNNFFKGKPIDRENFALICDRLDLDLEVTVATTVEPDHHIPDNQADIDALVQSVRQKTHNSIQKRCGMMRVLNMEQPIGIDSIYTTVNILEKLQRNQRLSIEELLKDCNLEDFDRLTLNRIRQKRVPGLEVVKHNDKLMILGKPGAGKTTFLKWLAIQCNAGVLLSDRVPIFITLKEFAETSGQPILTEYIHLQLRNCGVTENEVAQRLLLAGRAIVLLDGLDEVRDVDHDRVLHEIRSAAEQFDASRFIITCRIAAREYTFQQFTEIEVADFDDQQIANFAKKWFQAKKDPVKAEEFPNKLKANPGLKELATNPLLLTLLCLVFEEQTGGFPSNQAELYKESINVLLKKWDAKRNIRRDEVYKQLSLNLKEDLLSQIGFNTFERSEYFFKQRAVEAQIIQYIRNLPGTNNDPEALQLDSEAILKSIEAQHGLLVERAVNIYSFSHLTFHEYFTAREIVVNDRLETLAQQIQRKRWREVFLLTVEMLPKADRCLQLMKDQGDQLLARDKRLQEFSNWVEQKSKSVQAPYKPAAVRDFYFLLALNLERQLALVSDFDSNRMFSLAKTQAKVLSYQAKQKALEGNIPIERNIVLDQAIDLDIVLDQAINLDIVLDQALVEALSLSLILTLTRDIDQARDLYGILCNNHNCDYNIAIYFTNVMDLVCGLTRAQKTEFAAVLAVLDSQLPDTDNLNQYQQWWKAQGQDWVKQLRSVAIQNRNIGHKWKFTSTQTQLLQQYYDANKLLVDCLNSECCVSQSVRTEIEDTLLLPIASIERYKSNQGRS